MAWVGRDLKAHLIPVLLPLNQVAQSPIQPGLKDLQGWSIHSFTVPVPHHPLREEFPPNL